MNKSVFIEYDNTYNEGITIQFLTDLDSLEKGTILNKTISDNSFIMCELLYDEKHLNIDNHLYIFESLYWHLKTNNKKAIYKDLDAEAAIIWKNRVKLLSLIKDLKKKYPELKIKNLK